MISRDQVDQFRTEAVEDRAAVSGLPPGYLTGLESSIDTSGRLVVGAGIASVDGQRSNFEQTTITSELWVCEYIKGFQYYLYVSRSGGLFVDIIKPQFQERLYYLAHPYRGGRFVLTFKLNSDGKVQWFNYELDSSITAQRLQFSTSVGSQTNENPESGDVRTYLGKDPEGSQGSSDPVEMAIKEFNGENWETRLKGGMRSGGNVADLFVSGFFQAGESVLSSPGLIWTERTQPFTTSSIYGIASSTTAFVAVALNGKIARSTDRGNSWGSLLTNPFGTSNIYSVAYGNGVFVAVGDSGKIARSTDDGATWGSLITNPFGSTVIQRVVYTDGVWIAAGGSGKLARSTDDGATWGSLISTPFGTTAINGVGGYGDTWVIVGTSNSIAISTDGGVTWDSPTTYPTGLSNMYGVSYGEGSWVISGQSGKLARSVDNGITWADVTSPFGANLVYSVSFYSGVFIACGHGGTLYRSTDGGATWTNNTYSDSAISQPFGATAIFLDIWASPDLGRWVVVGALSGSGVLATSDWLEAGSGIVEQGSNPNGNYVVFSSGLQVCWALYTSASVAISTAYIGGFRSAGVTVSLPKAFADTNYIVASTANQDNLAWVSNFDSGRATTSFVGFFTAFSSQTAATRGVGYIAIGEAG